METRSREQIRHFPGFACSITACTGQVYIVTRRMASRSIPQMLHVPFLSSRTSGCIGQVHETEGSWVGGFAVRSNATKRIPKARAFIGSVASVADGPWYMVHGLSWSLVHGRWSSRAAKTSENGYNDAEPSVASFDPANCTCAIP